MGTKVPSINHHHHQQLHQHQVHYPSQNTTTITNNNHNNHHHQPHPTVVATTGATVTTPHNPESYIGLYGWRRKCLFILILGLMILIVLNLALTLWILKVMEFSPDGMGQLKVIPGGIQLSGQTIVLDLLRASTIKSKYNQPLSIESSRNFSVNTRSSDGFIENQLYLGHDKLECQANHFRITDSHGDLLFAANRDEVTIGANSLRMDGDGGIIFRESIQTPLVRLDAGKEMRLESPTKTVEMTAAKDIIIQSRAGNIDASCLNDIKFHSIAGSLHLDSGNIIVPNLRIAPTPTPGSLPTANHEHTHKIYQLCACANGKLFLAPSHSICSSDDTTVCR